jgi:iron uptake system EfeUOB component EfeO/EfeM
MLRAALTVAGAALLLTAAGCGDNHSSPPRKQSAALPLSARNPNLRSVDPPTPADYAAPTAAYRRHVRAELATMLPDVRALRAATARGDLRAARRAWLAASARYETIGAAYGAFGDLDAAVNGRPGGLPGGVRSPDFRGLHRIELALWGRRSTRDAQAPARQLVADVARMRAKLVDLKIDPLEYSLRAHEVLEDTIHLQLAGIASPWSQNVLPTLRANVAGTRVVLRTLDTMISRQDTTGALPLARRGLTRIDRELHAIARRHDGRLPRWDALSQRERERINGVTAGAAEALAYIPEIIDPRPRRPLQKPTG